jgi:monofunctional biosynthetic peptidoglycan transglycosylase
MGRLTPAVPGANLNLSTATAGRPDALSGGPQQEAVGKDACTVNAMPAGAPQMNRVHSLLRRVGRRLAHALLLFMIGSVCLVSLYSLAPPPLTPLMVIRLFEGEGLSGHWRPLSRIDPNLVRAVIAAEDTTFCRHWGFDLDAIEAAWARNQQGGRILGGSTISMQTAKNVFLWPGRTWVRKALEAWFTVLIEAGWSKSRIVETYLNVAEWGPGIYGADGAARHWFGVDADQLTRRQAALLAATLPAPRRFRPDAPTAHLASRAAVIETRMAALGPDDLPPCTGGQR